VTGSSGAEARFRVWGVRGRKGTMATLARSKGLIKASCRVRGEAIQRSVRDSENRRRRESGRERAWRACRRRPRGEATGDWGDARSRYMRAPADDCRLR
jgi:hypothetical protein